MFKFKLFLLLLLSSNCIVPSKTDNATIYSNTSTTLSQFLLTSHTHTSTSKTSTTPTPPTTSTSTLSEIHFYPTSLTSTSSTITNNNYSNNSNSNSNGKNKLIHSTKFIIIVSISGFLFLSSVIVITIALCNPETKKKTKIYKVPTAQSFDNPLFDYTRLNDNQIISGYNNPEPTTTLYDESYASYNEETY
jgi:hypothetical protein